MSIIFTAKINTYPWFVTLGFGEKVSFSYCVSNPKDTYVVLEYHTKLMLSRKRCKKRSTGGLWRVPINGVILCECVIGRKLDIAVRCVFVTFPKHKVRKCLFSLSGHNSCPFYLLCTQANLTHISTSPVAACSEQPGQIQQLREECDYSLLFKVRTWVFFKAGADGSHQPPVYVHINGRHARRIMRLMFLPCGL